MQHSSSCEFNRFLASQEIPHILWNPKVFASARIMILSPKYKTYINVFNKDTQNMLTYVVGSKRFRPDIKSHAKWKMLWGIYSAIYGEVNVSVENCVEIKGDYVEKK